MSGPFILNHQNQKIPPQIRGRAKLSMLEKMGFFYTKMWFCRSEKTREKTKSLFNSESIMAAIVIN